MDLAAELESRLLTASQTEDTVDSNPWALAQGTTLTTNSVATPVIPADSDSPAIHVRSETEGDATYDQRAADAELEQKHLTTQLKTLALEVKRIRFEAAAARALQREDVEPASWSARELRLLLWAIAKWKRLRTCALAEEILTGAVELREANVIS